MWLVVCASLLDELVISRMNERRRPCASTKVTSRSLCGFNEYFFVASNDFAIVERTMVVVVVRRALLAVAAVCLSVCLSLSLVSHNIQ